MPAKRQTFSGRGLPAAKNARAFEGTEVLVACVRSWGSAFWVFKGAEASVPLWQIQFTGTAHRLFTFQMLAAVRDWLQDQKDEEMKTLNDLHSAWHVRIVTGGPAGETDVDGVGVCEWAPAIYCAGPSPSRALEVISGAIAIRARKKSMLSLPRFKVWTGAAPGFQVPEPWEFCGPTEILPPKPFGVLPPGGKRHVLAQLEKEDDHNKENEESVEQDKYMLSFFGGLFHFRERFDQKQIVGTSVEKDDSDEKTYIRILDGGLLNNNVSRVEVLSRPQPSKSFV
ncbi:unnamed protein product [Durusdinium trenchii]|uniref:Uncharacterized protein n=2 Tax=Durusdinium trenchii TaxID=1381693 RepID=A0ABP0J6Z6_9DINO